MQTTRRVLPLSEVALSSALSTTSSRNRIILLGRPKYCICLSECVVSPVCRISDLSRFRCSIIGNPTLRAFQHGTRDVWRDQHFRTPGNFVKLSCCVDELLDTINLLLHHRSPQNDKASKPRLCLSFLLPCHSKMDSFPERDRQTLARVSWLQSLLSHRIVPESFAKHLYQRCCAVAHYTYSEADYRSMTDEASKQLSLLDLEIRSSREQGSGKRVLALVNTKNDDVITGATRYSALEISFIKKLVEEIFKARREAYSLPALEAVRLGGKLRSHMTRDATEELLKNLVDHRWIDYSA